MDEKFAPKKKIKLLGVVALFTLIAGIGVTQSFDRISRGDGVSLLGSALKPASPVAAPQGVPDFVTVAKQLRLVVVNISATQVQGQGQRFSSPFGSDDPFEEFFGMPRPPGSAGQRRSQGSGFIIDRAGTILTNHHLIEGAKRIIVKLSTGKQFDAKVVGKDPRTDIAVLKIDGGVDFSAIPLGNSDQLEIGEWVLAVGNPFGLDNSVTSGIVSAKSRFIGAGPYDDFIQTDASVNPGNSGGPLVNLRGEVVGMTSVIVSQTGANVGIGFAIPINLVKELLPQLQAKGKITRGWLGVGIQGLTPEIADSLGVKRTDGALVTEVIRDGPAQRAGIKAADVIIEYDGNPIKDAKALPLLVARTPVEKQVKLKLLRENKELALSATIAELQEAGPKRQQEVG